MRDRDNSELPEQTHGAVQRGIEQMAELSFLKLGARVMAFAGVPVAAFLVNAYLSDFHDDQKRTADGVDRIAAQVEADGRILSSLQTQVQDQGEILREHGQRLTNLEDRTFRGSR